MMVGISVNAQVKNQTPKRAETTTPIKGDVNEDGVVDVADINAVIEIMKNGGGTSGETKYYWYVGQEPPTSISTNPNTVTGAVPGWHEIGTSIGTYTFASPLYNSEANPITSNPSKNSNWYVAFPSTSSLGVYDSADRNEVTNGNWTTEQPITVAGITYNVYKSVGTYRNFNVWWIHTEESQTKYYWYVGQNQPTAINDSSEWRTSTTDAGFTATVTVEGDPANGKDNWLVYPSNWTYSAVDSEGDDFEFNAFVAANIKNSINGYTIKRIVMFGSDTITITFSK